jgi:hypothetical protein
MATTQASGPEPGLADDEAGFKRGRGSMLVGLLLAAALALVGLWRLLSGGDDARVYGELGRKINGLSQGNFDQFWACAFAGKNLHDVKTNADLITQLDGRAAEGGARYGVYLRDKCLGKLREIEPTLDTLIIPEDLRQNVDALKAATSKLRSGMSAFATYLDTPGHDYDAESAKVYFDSIARGWFDFRTAHNAINKTLKARLEHDQ